MKFHQVVCVVLLLSFEKSYAVGQILWAGKWKSLSTFSAFYLRDVNYKSMDTLAIWPVVATQQVS